MHSYSISMRYPLFEGGGGSARLRGAWAEFYSAQQQLEAAKRAASGRARAAWVNLESATERVQATRQAVKTAETNLDASRKAVQAGTARVTDVLLALAQNTRAKRDLNEAGFSAQWVGWSWNWQPARTRLHWRHVSPLPYTVCDQTELEGPSFHGYARQDYLWILA